ncbi:DAW1 [Mytilus coruscus]|uniref:Dynein assembly factor with WD repeat domains 1 n=1 Tax=Mytilus coruscus TaxID=42192 RepID=A0A6J8DX91_MYTCO|nr:DAW1 [Mytilus coruscus]
MATIFDKAEKRFQDVFSTRWLSFEGAVSSLLHNFDILIGCLLVDEEGGNIVAGGLVGFIYTSEFLAVSHFMGDVMGIVCRVSRVFQREDLTFSVVKDVIDPACAAILGMKSTAGPRLESFLPEIPSEVQDSGNFLFDGNLIKDSSSHRSNFESLRVKFSDQLVLNLQSCFPSQQIFQSLSIFDPQFVPSLGSQELLSYGKEQVDFLCIHFGQDKGSHKALISEVHFREEWLMFKQVLTGIILEYEQGGNLKTKSIDLLDLKPETDVDAVVDEISRKEPLITASKADQVRKLIQRLQEKLAQKDDHHFYLFKVLRAHILPLTNVGFNKSGSSFITGSYDRTCKVWDTASGEELHTLEGHKNVVYAIAFNNPYGDKIATGSFDKTCKLWSSETGKCYHTYRGHSAEIVCLSFNPQSSIIATGSMDTTAKLWDVQTGSELVTLSGHSAEIISLSFNSTGSQLITGSFDHTVSVWDVKSGKRIHTLIGHKAEISSAQFNWDCSLIATGSMDKTCKIWDTPSGRCIGTLRGHDDEVLDVAFDYTGQMLLTASADGTARCYNAVTHQLISKFEGHEGEISKITFNPQGTSVLTASSDKTARLWDPENGSCKQILEGHTDEIFSCAFNYEGNTIITGSKDNTCRIWR